MANMTCSKCGEPLRGPAQVQAVLKETIVPSSKLGSLILPEVGTEIICGSCLGKMLGWKATRIYV